MDLEESVEGSVSETDYEIVESEGKDVWRGEERRKPHHFRRKDTMW
jgi:hypothetical protein